MSEALEMTGQEQEAQLFERYIEICNLALARHKETFPYKQMLAASEAVLFNTPIPVAVVDDEPKSLFSIRLRNQHLDVAAMPDVEKTPWRLKKSYLKEVVDHPQDYINNPAKIDWEWLKSQL